MFREYSLHLLNLYLFSANFETHYHPSQEDDTGWLLTDKVSSWSQTPAERGWNYIQQSLSRHDSAQTDYRYSKAVLETILTHDKGSGAPPWLIQALEVHQTSLSCARSLLHFPDM